MTKKNTDFQAARSRYEKAMRDMTRVMARRRELGTDITTISAQVAMIKNDYVTDERVSEGRNAEVRAVLLEKVLRDSVVYQDLLLRVEAVRAEIGVADDRLIEARGWMSVEKRVMDWEIAQKRAEGAV